MSDYSNTPLQKKLGIKPGYRCHFAYAPKNFLLELGRLPENTTLVRTPQRLDFILLFVTSEAVLVRKFPKLKEALEPSGMIWVGWPKKASGARTDLSFERVQRIGLDAGLVDVKICAINEIWSGLKFVYRLKDRSTL